MTQYRIKKRLALTIFVFVILLVCVPPNIYINIRVERAVPGAFEKVVMEEAC